MFVFALLTGCFGTATAPDATADPGLTAEELEDCRDACNQQQFFDCYTAAEHALCFDHCDQATSDQADRFTACVGNVICDAECAIHIAPAATPVPSPVPNPVPSGPGDDCQTLCLDYLNDGCAPGLTAGDCLAACNEVSSLVVGCLEDRTSCSLPPACEPAFELPEDPRVEHCEDNCQRLGTFRCITTLDVVECADRCSTESDIAVDQFNICADADPICSDDSCYRILNSAGASGDVPGCRDTCDRMEFFSCLTANQQLTCRTTCATASYTAIENFKACGQGLCDNDTCYQNLLVAP